MEDQLFLGVCISYARERNNSGIWMNSSVMNWVNFFIYCLDVALFYCWEITQVLLAQEKNTDNEETCSLDLR